MTLGALIGSGCGSSEGTYTVGGTLQGLGSGLTVVLKNNGSDALALTDNGIFTFPAALEESAGYAVTVETQPIGQTCAVANGSGTLGGANATNVTVTCIFAYSVGGSLSGLYPGETLVLKNNGGNDLMLSDNGDFAFADMLEDGAGYAVVVEKQPTGQTCSVANGSGTVDRANVTSVAVTCILTYRVDVRLSGLSSGKTVVLLNNGGDALMLMNDGVYTFATPLEVNTSYAVTVGTHPEGEECEMSSFPPATGTSSGPDVRLFVTCCDPSIWGYRVKGTVTGLGAGRSVALQINGMGYLSVGANASGEDVDFSFENRLMPGDYEIEVVAQPVDQACSVANGEGTIVDHGIADVLVTCVAL
jgi:hypothetical protein